MHFPYKLSLVVEFSFCFTSLLSKAFDKFLENMQQTIKNDIHFEVWTASDVLVNSCRQVNVLFSYTFMRSDLLLLFDK